MHIRHKRTLAAIAALSTASLGLMALSPSPASALNGIDVTVSSTTARSTAIPVDGHGTYFIKNADVGDVLTFTAGEHDPVLGHRPGARRGGPRGAGQRGRPSPTSAVPFTRRLPGGRRYRPSPSRTSLPPRRWLPTASPVVRRTRPPSTPGWRLSWRGRRRHTGAVRGRPDPDGQPEPEPGLDPDGDQLDRRWHGDPRWHALLGQPGRRCRHSRCRGPGHPGPDHPARRCDAPERGQRVDLAGLAQLRHRRPHGGWCPQRHRHPAEQPRCGSAHPHRDRAERHAVRRQRSVEHGDGDRELHRGRSDRDRLACHRAGRHRGHHHR